jgi:tRNA(Leu) C34 or U34 (ribose-2'-O)-methylase TrmL
MKRGYFGIGMYHPKTVDNLGTLWRSAYQLGASFIFTIGARYKRQASDTYKTWRHIPLITYDDWEAFQKGRAYDCQLVVVEFTPTSVPIKTFNHPERAIYLLGAEDAGFPPEITKNNICLELPSVRQPSFNVAVAGSIVMYDRLIK